MGIGKQAKVLTKKQSEMVLTHLAQRTQNGVRNQLIFLLSIKSGLRAKEIANLKWVMVLDCDGVVGDTINLPNSSSKGNSGRIIPLHVKVRELLITMLKHTPIASPDEKSCLG